jgi:hypothetical protein
MLNQLLLERFVAQENIILFGSALQSGRLQSQQMLAVTDCLARAKAALVELDRRVAALPRTLRNSMVSGGADVKA